MPDIVKEMTENERLIEKEILGSFSEEQICAYFLSKNLRSIYQFNDEFIDNWYDQLFDSKPTKKASKREELVLEYANMLLVERKFDNHMKYWVRQLQSDILLEMKIFFDGEGGK